MITLARRSDLDRRGKDDLVTRDARLGRGDRSGLGRRHDLAVLSADIVGPAVVSALLVEAPVVLVADELLLVVLVRGLVPGAVRSVADDALVALLFLPVGVVAEARLADDKLVPVVVVALAGGTVSILTDNLPLGASRAVNLRSTVVAVADDHDVGGNNSDDSGGGGDSGSAINNSGDSSSGGNRRQGLGLDSSDSVGNGVSGAIGVEVDRDVDAEENRDVDSLAAAEARGRSDTTARLAIITRAGDVARVGAHNVTAGSAQDNTAVASVVVGTKVVGTLTSSGARLESVVLSVSSQDEGRETVVGSNTAVEVEVANGAGGAGLAGAGAGAAGRGGRVSRRLSAGGDGRRVGELSGGELGICQVAHGEGEELSVTHLGWLGSLFCSE